MNRLTSFFFKRWYALTPMTKKAPKMYAPAYGVNELDEGEFLGDHIKETGQFRPAAGLIDHITHRMLHPGIGGDDPVSRYIGRDSHYPNASRMGFGREPVPGKGPHRDKGGFQKE